MMSIGINNDVNDASTQARARIVELLRAAGTQQNVARALRISVPTLQRILASNAPIGIDLIYAIADLVGVPAANILDGESCHGATNSFDQRDPSVGRGHREGSSGAPRTRIAPTSSRPDVLAIAEVDIKYGLGGSFLQNNPAVEMRDFAAEWVRQFTKAPAEMLFLCRGIGDSMEPTLKSDDILLIDRSQKTIRMNDLIYALSHGQDGHEIGMVKRIRIASGSGDLHALSDNPNVPDEIFSDGAADIVGRVVAIVRKL